MADGDDDDNGHSHDDDDNGHSHDDHEDDDHDDEVPEGGVATGAGGAADSAIGGTGLLMAAATAVALVGGLLAFIVRRTATGV